MRRSASGFLALGAILLLGFAGLLRPQGDCAMRACPLMPAAAASDEMPCHAAGSIGAAMDCCDTPPATAPTAAPSLAGPPAAAQLDGLVAAAAADVPAAAVRLLEAPRPHRALLHELGLYTLHSVFRI